MKRVINTFIIILLLISLVACKKEDEKDLRLMSSLEVTEIMGIGINLGNTMEAYGKESYGVDAEIARYETHWGAPVTTKEMIQGMKDAGFDTLRIPVAWTNTMDYENNNYTIRQDYIDRVTEIVNYALDADMFVIVNEHWSGGWWGMFGSPDLNIRSKAEEIFIEIWTQVGNHFKDYSYKLIFEAGNEELGNRLNDEIDGVPGVLNIDELYAETNRINQLFVDTIRAQGSKNKDRFLLIPGYNTDIKMTLDERFIMPEDSVDDKLLISVHYYDPSSYTIGGSNTFETKEEYQAQNEMLESLTKFTDDGYGVIIGEWGVLPNSDGSLKENRFEYSENFLNNMDLYGYVPVLWDRSDYFSREELKVLDERFEQLFLEKSYNEQKKKTREEIIDSATAAIALALENAVDDLYADIPQAWLMFVGNDWGITYSVGDKYIPSSKTAGVEATDVEIKGEGTYTVSLDFNDTYADSINEIVFMALAIYNGEKFFPNSVITITEFKINGSDYPLKGISYTTSDDQNTTRVNIYNGWVNNTDINRDEIRVEREQQKPYATAQLLNPEDEGLKNILTIEVTFKVTLPK